MPVISWPVKPQTPGCSTSEPTVPIASPIIHKSRHASLKVGNTHSKVDIMRGQWSQPCDCLRHQALLPELLHIFTSFRPRLTHYTHTSLAPVSAADLTVAFGRKCLRKHRSCTIHTNTDKPIASGHRLDLKLPKPGKAQHLVSRWVSRRQGFLNCLAHEGHKRVVIPLPLRQA